MPVEIPAAKIALMLAKDIVPKIQSTARHCSDFNDLPNIPWYLRQKVRTIEGFLDKAEMEIMDMLDRSDIDEAHEYSEATWA